MRFTTAHRLIFTWTIRAVGPGGALCVWDSSPERLSPAGCEMFGVLSLTSSFYVTSNAEMLLCPAQVKLWNYCKHIGLLLKPYECSSSFFCFEWSHRGCIFRETPQNGQFSFYSSKHTGKVQTSALCALSVCCYWPLMVVKESFCHDHIEGKLAQKVERNLGRFY